MRLLLLFRRTFSLDYNNLFPLWEYISIRQKFSFYFCFNTLIRLTNKFSISFRIISAKHINSVFVIYARNVLICSRIIVLSQLNCLQSFLFLKNLTKTAFTLKKIWGKFEENFSEDFPSSFTLRKFFEDIRYFPQCESIKGKNFSGNLLGIFLLFFLV